MRVVQFVARARRGRDVTFVDFDTSVSLGFFKPASYPQLFERIRARKADGWTALYDALGVYLERALSRPGQHVLLLYTDGGDSTSRMTFGNLIELLRLGNVMVYAIGYLENQSSTLRAPQQMRMNQIARETGGEAFFPASAEELHEVYAKILDELRLALHARVRLDEPEARRQVPQSPGAGHRGRTSRASRSAPDRATSPQLRATPGLSQA